MKQKNNEYYKFDIFLRILQVKSYKNIKKKEYKDQKKKNCKIKEE
jgi:predicted N-acyltransferase